MENFFESRPNVRKNPACFAVRRGDLWGFAAALVVAGLVFGSPAGAQPRYDNAAPTDTTEPEPNPAHLPKKKKKKNKESGGKRKNPIVSPAGRAEIKGRLVARSELRAQPGTIVNTEGQVERGQIESLDFSIATARLSLHYEAPMPWLTGVVEFELAGKPDLKDGYIQARFDHFQLRAGQFKAPVAPQESVSPFVLPTVHRGFTSQLLTDWLDVGGRRPGLMLSYHAPGALRPSLSLAAFQASTATEILAGDRDTDRIAFKTLDAQSFVARAQIEHGPVSLGAWYEYRLGSPGLNLARRYSTAGADLTWDGGDKAGGLRAWLSGVVGESWYRHNAIRSQGPETTFATGRLLAGYRLFGTERDAFYFEPFGFCGVFDPDLKLSHDLALETAIGMNIGFWRRVRFTLQLESVVADTYFPKGSLGYLAGEEPRRESLYAQVMLVF
jgi:hypothetical protein